MQDEYASADGLDRPKRPTALKGVVFLVVIAVIAAGLGAFALNQRSEEGPLVLTETPRPISAKVRMVRMAERLDLDETFTGLAAARRTSQLGFSTGGRVETLRADVGDRFETGAQLASLDTRGLRAQLAAAEARIVEAEASYALALQTVNRQRTLRAQGHVSQQRVDEAVAQADTSLALINAMKAQADVLRVEIDLATIRAPFDGVVTQRMMDEGAIAAPGAPILELVESSRLEARIGLPARVAADLIPGEDYMLQSDRGPVAATLRSTTGVIDAGQRTVTTVFDIADPDSVAAGSVLRIELDREIDERGFWAPVSALAETSRGLWSIYVAAEQGGRWTVEPRLVEIVHSAGDDVFVRGAVDDGERIIVDGLQRLTPGQPITPVADEILTAGGQ